MKKIKIFILCLTATLFLSACAGGKYINIQPTAPVAGTEIPVK